MKSGSKSLTSEILNGNRDISKSKAKALAEFFHVSARVVYLTFNILGKPLLGARQEVLCWVARPHVSEALYVNH